MVTNDQYRDHVAGVGGKAEQQAARLWTKTHLISFTFVKDEFLPNPGFTWPDA